MIKVITVDPPAFDRAEILRYMGAKTEDPMLSSLIDSCIDEAKSVLEDKVVYTIEPIICAGDMLRFGNIKTESVSLHRALDRCESVLIFAATIGVGFDRLLSRYSRIMPSKALVMQAIGTERIESLCDAFCGVLYHSPDFAEKTLRRRVSPGYGDIPLEMQTQLFELLDCPRKIGLTLNSRLLMSPIKSVTAIAGISDNCREQGSASSCSLCTKGDCRFRTE